MAVIAQVLVQLIAVGEGSLQPAAEPEQNLALVGDVVGWHHMSLTGRKPREPAAVIPQKSGPAEGAVGVRIAKAGYHDSPRLLVCVNERLGPARMGIAMGFPDDDNGGRCGTNA